jgi:hypothetical protein
VHEISLGLKEIRIGKTEVSKNITAALGHTHRGCSFMRIRTHNIPYLKRLLARLIIPSPRMGEDRR